jgi:tetratricopeptide (TPR) repeat protein
LWHWRSVMRQISADKYTVAWFRLAECVSRGEKERALGVYRLLSHSIDDHALVIQLEGDILLSFNDDNAIEKYQIASALYKKDNRFLQAVALYEHLVSLKPHHIPFYQELIDLYALCNMQDNQLHAQGRLLFVLIESNSAQEVVVAHMHQLLDDVLISSNESQLQHFLLKLKAVSNVYYAQAVDYLDQK